MTEEKTWGSERGGSQHKTLFMNMSSSDLKQQPSQSWTPLQTANINGGRQREHNANMSHAK